MFFQRNTMTTLLMATMLLAGTNLAKAEGTTAAAPAAASTSSGSSSFFENIRPKLKASYTMNLSGMNSKAMDGNTDGTGTNLSVEHYLSGGYKFPKNMSLTGTALFIQSINDAPNESQDKFFLTDPYLTFSHSKLYDNEKIGMNVSGYIRYYVPSSVQTRNGVNDFSSKEQGNGRLRVGVTPSKTWLDGALSLSVPSFLVYRLAKHSTNDRFLNQQQKDPETGNYLRDETTGAILRNSATGYNGSREDFYFLINPAIGYTISPKWDISLDWATGLIRHNTQANPAKKLPTFTNAGTKDPDYGQSLTFSASYQATKKLSLNPAASWGPVYEGLRNTNFSLLASYTFL